MTEQGLIYGEKPQQCDLCGEVAELRPYGPNGECVCFECGMKDEKAAKRQFGASQGWNHACGCPKLEHERCEIHGVG